MICALGSDVDDIYYSDIWYTDGIVVMQCLVFFTKINGANGYQKMARSLATKYKQASIDSESKGIVNGLSDILEASEMTSSNAIENKKTVVDWLDDSNSKGSTEILQKVKYIKSNIDITTYKICK